MATTVLLQCLVSKLLENAGLLRERGVPQPLNLDLFEDGRGQRVLVRGGQPGGRFEGLLELIGHGTNLWEGGCETKNGTPSNGSRLSCGRPARRRKGSGRQSVPRQRTTLRFARAITARQLQ